MPLNRILDSAMVYNVCDITVKRFLKERKEGNVLFNDVLNTFYSTVIWRRTYNCDKGPLRQPQRKPAVPTDVYLKQNYIR